MTNESTRDNEPPEDVMGVASKLAQVAPEKKRGWYYDKLTWVMIGVVIFVLLAMFLGGEKKKEKPGDVSNSATSAPPNYNAELSENLAHLHQMSQEIKEKANQINSINLGNDANEKQVLARQNAPTTMFSDTSPNTATGSASHNGTAQAVFAGQGVYTAFGNQTNVASSVSAEKIAHPRETIASGEFLHAILETAIDSDLPGEIRAVVSQPVYAYVGEEPLIPAGSRLIGQYSSSVLQGQDRVFVIWNRVILPSGISAQLNSPGVDEIGQAGQGADSVNTHFFARFGEAALLSIIGAGASTVGVNGGQQYNSEAQYRMAISQSFQQSANESLQNTVQTQPTLRIFQGADINVFVAHDIDFYSVLDAQRKEDVSAMNQPYAAIGK